MKTVKDKNGKDWIETEPGFGIPKRNIYVNFVFIAGMLAVVAYILLSIAPNNEQMYKEITIKLDDPQYVKDLGCAKLRFLTQMDDVDGLGQPVLSPPPPKELMDKIFLTMKNTNCKTYEELKESKK